MNEIDPKDLAEFERTHGKVRRLKTVGPSVRRVELTAEDSFAAAWAADPMRGVEMVREHRFHPERKWRFDAAFPSHRVAVELNGWGSGGHAGRHHGFVGARADAEKMTAAATLGWRVLVFMSADKKNAADWVRTVKLALACRPLCPRCSPAR